jgi:oligopeptide transport system substrate-binding protein
MTPRSFRAHSTRLLRLTIIITMAGCNPPPTPIATATPTPQSAPATGEPQPASPTTSPDPVSISVSLGRHATIDPALVGPMDAAGHDLIANLFGGLAALDPDTGTVTPSIAEHWERSSDGLTWTVYLRNDLSWVRVNSQSGAQEKVRALNASDAVFAVRRACLHATNAPLAGSIFVIRGCREINSAPPADVTPEFIDQNLGARVLNDTTVEFKLVRDTGIFLTLLAMPILYPVPADLLESAGEEWTDPDQVWTSGPFTVQPGTQGQALTLLASDYWPLERSGNVDVVNVLDTEPEQAFDAWGVGDLAVSIVPPGQILSTPFGDDPLYWLHVQPAAAMLAISYDLPPMERPGVRQALSFALDRQTLIDEVWEAHGGIALPAQNITPPGMAGAPVYGTTGTGYDPEAAKAALADAGYPNCIRIPQISLLVDDAAASVALAERIVEMWIDTLGCDPSAFVIEQETQNNVEVFLKEPPTQIQRQFRYLRPGAILMHWQGDYLDAHHWLADIAGCREIFPRSYVNSTRACTDADDTIAAAEKNPDMAVRVSMYADAENALFGVGGEMPVIPLFFYARPLAFQEWVEFYPLHAGPLRFDRWVVTPSDGNDQ